ATYLHSRVSALSSRVDRCFSAGGTNRGGFPNADNTLQARVGTAKLLRAERTRPQWTRQRRADPARTRSGLTRIRRADPGARRPGRTHAAGAGQESRPWRPATPLSIRRNPEDEIEPADHRTNPRTARGRRPV